MHGLACAAYENGRILSCAGDQVLHLLVLKTMILYMKHQSMIKSYTTKCAQTMHQESKAVR